MNLKLSIHRNGAGAEVEIEGVELDDPARLYAVAQPWIEYLERSVAGVPAGPPARPASAPAGGGEARNGPPAAARPDRGDPPRSGRQLLGWANKAGKHEELMRLAKAWDLGRIVDWSRDDVAAAHRELSRGEPAAWGGGR